MCPALCLHHCAVPHLNHLQATGDKTETPSFDLTKWQSHAKETSPHYSGVQSPKGQVPKLATKVKKTAKPENEDERESDLEQESPYCCKEMTE